MAEKPSERYFIELAYNGTNYHGWQVQPNATSIQGEIERALTQVTREKIKVVGCGRTDTGVHASYYVAHVDLINLSIKPHSLIKGANTHLKNDIYLKSISSVSQETHARFSALSRRYVYKIIKEHDPFKTNLAFHYHNYSKIDFDLLQKAGALILQYSDFKSLAKVGSDVDNFECEMTESAWSKTDDGLEYKISSNRFLRGMVRLIVGMCLDISVGLLGLSHVQDVLEKRLYPSKRWSVPAKGLYLTDIIYSPKNFAEHDLM